MLNDFVISSSANVSSKFFVSCPTPSTFLTPALTVKVIRQLICFKSPAVARVQFVLRVADALNCQVAQVAFCEDLGRALRQDVACGVIAAVPVQSGIDAGVCLAGGAGAAGIAGACVAGLGSRRCSLLRRAPCRAAVRVRRQHRAAAAGRPGRSVSLR